MGGTVICTKTGRVFQNATIVNDCENCPADIDEVGYEYHAGTFVPCAPYGVHGTDGHIMVSCGDCATPKRSKYKLSELAKIEVGSYVGSGASLATIEFDRAPSVVLIVGAGTYNTTVLGDYAGVAEGGMGVISPAGGFASDAYNLSAGTNSSHYVKLAQLDVRSFGTTVSWTSMLGVTSHPSLSNGSLDAGEPILNTSGITYQYIAFFDWGE
jgi:hypothetical protein